MSLNYENVGKNVIYNRSVDNIEDYVKGTIVGCYIGEDEEYYVTSIESSGECIKVYDDSLIEIIEGGGSGAVSSVNGQTGTVVLDAEDVGAEPEKMVITVTHDAVNDEYTADKTFAEILAAYEAGKTLVAFSFYDFVFMYLYSYDGEQFVFANTICEDSPVISTFVYVLETDGTWNNYSVSYPLGPAIFDVPGTTPTITPALNTIYKCGELTSLTISNPPATGKYSIVFFSGTTPTTTVGIENFAAEANKRYKITVEDNYATYDSWPYTPA